VKFSHPITAFISAAVVCLAVLLGPARAEMRTKMTGLVGLKTAVDTTWDVEAEDVWSNQFYSYGEAVAAWGFDYGAFVSALLEYRLDHGESVSGELAPEIRELYAKFRFGALKLFVGQQVVSWAVSDAISPLDQLNPVDYSRLLDREVSFSRRGTVMIRPELTLGPVTLEGAYLPLFTPARYDVVGGDWALGGEYFPLYLLLDELRKSADWRRLETFAAQWWPSWRGDLREYFSDPDYWEDRTDRPDMDLTAPEAAVRLTYRSSAIDLTAAYFYLWDDLPTLHVNPRLYELEDYEGRTAAGFAVLPPLDEETLEAVTGDLVRLTHHRTSSVGLGFSTILADVVFRGEGLLEIDRLTYRRNLETTRRHQVKWVADVEYTFDNNLMLKGVLWQKYLLGREDDFFCRAWTHILALAFRQTFLDEVLTLEGLGAWDLTTLNGADWRRQDIFAGGWSLDFYLTYAITDPFKLTLGTNLFGGREDTLLGYLEGNSRVSLMARYSF